VDTPQGYRVEAKKVVREYRQRHNVGTAAR